MTNPYKKVNPGDDFRMSASLYNTLCDMAYAYKNSGRIGDQAVAFKTKIKVLNYTDQDLGFGDAVGIEEPLFGVPINGDDINRKFKHFRDRNYIAVTPRDELKIGITETPIRKGEVGTVILNGLVRAEVDVKDVSHERVTFTQDTVNLESSTDGDLSFFIKPTSTGKQWCDLVFVAKRSIIIAAAKIAPKTISETEIQVFYGSNDSEIPIDGSMYKIWEIIYPKNTKSEDIPTPIKANNRLKFHYSGQVPYVGQIYVAHQTVILFGYTDEKDELSWDIISPMFSGTLKGVFDRYQSDREACYVNVVLGGTQQHIIRANDYYRDIAPLRHGDIVYLDYVYNQRPNDRDNPVGYQIQWEITSRPLLKRQIKPVTVVSDGGEQGTGEQAATWTYAIRDFYSNEIIATNVNPTLAPNKYMRPSTGARKKATFGYCHLINMGDAEMWAVGWLNEIDL